MLCHFRAITNLHHPSPRISQSVNLEQLPGTAHPVGVLVEGVNKTVAGNAPHFDGLVIRGRHQSLAIVGESNTSHSSSVRFDDL